MNRKWWKLIYLLPISLCTLYAGGYLTQFIRNYNIWSAAGNTPGNGSSPQMPSPHPAACFQAVTDFPYNLYGDRDLPFGIWTADLPSHADGL